MAQTKGKSTKKKTTTTKKQAAAKKTAAVSNKQKNTTKESDVVFADYWHAFTKTRFFKVILVILIIAAIIGVDLLISWDDYNKFFTFLGFEILIAAVIWVLGMIFSIGSSKKNNNEVN